LLHQLHYENYQQLDYLKRERKKEKYSFFILSVVVWLLLKLLDDGEDGLLPEVPYPERFFASSAALRKLSAA